MQFIKKHFLKCKIKQQLFKVYKIQQKIIENKLLHATFINVGVCNLLKYILKSFTNYNKMQTQDNIKSIRINTSLNNYKNKIGKGN